VFYIKLVLVDLLYIFMGLPMVIFWCDECSDSCGNTILHLIYWNSRYYKLSTSPDGESAVKRNIIWLHPRVPTVAAADYV